MRDAQLAKQKPAQKNKRLTAMREPLEGDLMAIDESINGKLRYVNPTAFEFFEQATRFHCQRAIFK